VNFSDCEKLKKTGNGVKFMGDADFHGSGIEEIGNNVTFESYACFTGCKHLKKIGE
jgi:hypothetical protein